jgi:acetyltransferase-like isoleucine patch superfamily enzyme
MALKSLNQLRSFRNALIRLRDDLLLKGLKGIVLEPNTSISLSARFRSARRGDIVIGSETLVAFKTLFLTQDPLTDEIRPIRIGSRCFIGGCSVILPGVTVGNECIVGGGSVVFDDIPDRCVVVGNPARVLRRDIEVGPFGRLKGADEKTREMYQL